MTFSNDDKLKAFLKRESNRLGISIGNTYNTYFSRLLLERISRLSYDKLYIKGSFSLLSNLNTMIRPVTDIDIVSNEYHNEPILTLYRAMYDSNDNIVYELTDLPKITKTGIYKLHLLACFGKIKHPISVDFQELSNTIYEVDYKEVLPIFKEDQPYFIYTPSYEEHLAEKLCIVLENNKENVLNTRVKDFYDIYKLAGGKYDEEKLSYFFSRMIYDRNKLNFGIEDRNVNFLNNYYINRHQALWDMMRKKYEFLDKEVTFEEALYQTKNLLDKELIKMEEKNRLEKRYK